MEKENNINELLSHTLTYIGGKENTESYMNCITRLRITVKDTDKVNMIKIQEISSPYRVLMNGNQLQIMLGPGLVNKAKSIFKELLEESH